MIMQSNPNGSHGSVLGPLWSIHFGVPYWMCVCLFRRTEFIDLFFGGGRKVLPSFQFPASEFAQYCLTCPTLIGFLGAYQLSEVSRGLPRFRRNWRRSWKIWTPLRRKSCINSRTPLRPGTEHLTVRRVWFFQDVFGACLAPRKDRKAVNIMPYRPPWGLGIKSGWHELWEVWWHLGAGIAVVYWCLLVIVTPK